MCSQLCVMCPMVLKKDKVRKAYCLFSSGHFLPVDRVCPVYFIVEKLTRRVVHISMITRRGVILT